jgi:hypothetical protein
VSDATPAPTATDADVYAHRRVHERDRATPLRVLVLGEALPLGAAGSRVVSALANVASEVRATVAVLAAESFEVERLTASGVEVAVGAGPSWLSERIGHPTVAVVLGPATAARVGTALRETQPQAAIVYDPTGEVPDDHVAARSAESFIIRSAEVVISPSDAHARFVAELAPSAHVVLAPPGSPEMHQALAQVLALAGVALPDAAFD